MSCYIVLDDKARITRVTYEPILREGEHGYEVLGVVAVGVKKLLRRRCRRPHKKEKR